MDTIHLTFSPNNCLHNVVSKTVLPNAPADEILHNEVVGNELYETFVNNRFHADVSIWAPFRKRHLKSFKVELDRRIKSTVQAKVLQLREEKFIFSRFLITSKNRPEINL